MTLTTVTPGAPAVELALAKQHLEVTGVHRDEYIKSLIAAAQQHIEQHLDRALTNTVLEERLIAATPGDVIRLRPRVQSVGEIKAGPEGVTVPSTSYAISGANGVRLAYGSVWPAADLVVRYTAGFGPDHDSIPAPLTHAILLLVGHWFASREAVASEQNIPREMPLGVEALIAPYRHWRA